MVSGFEDPPAATESPAQSCCWHEHAAQNRQVRERKEGRDATPRGGRSLEDSCVGWGGFVQAKLTSRVHLRSGTGVHVLLLGPRTSCY